MRVECPPHEASHRERGWEVPVRLDGLQLTQGDRSQARIDLKGDRIGSAGLAMSESRKLFTVSEEKFDLETGFVVPVERRGVQRLISAEQECGPPGPPVNDDDDPHRAAQSGEVDDRGFEPVIRVWGEHTGKNRRVPLGPIDLTGIATRGSTSSVRAGVEVTGVGVTSKFTDQIELEGAHPIDELDLAEKPIGGEVAEVGSVVLGNDPV